MLIHIQSKTLSVTAALRSFVHTQLTRLGRRGARIEGVTVFLDTIKRKKNDVTASVARIKVAMPGRDVVVEHRSADLYQAITEASHRVARRLREAKLKRLDHKRLHLELPTPALGF
jgi:ribosomal subunit interface protein